MIVGVAAPSLSDALVRLAELMLAWCRGWYYLWFSLMETVG